EVGEGATADAFAEVVLVEQVLLSRDDGGGVIGGSAGDGGGRRAFPSGDALSGTAAGRFRTRLRRHGCTGGSPALDGRKRQDLAPRPDCGRTDPCLAGRLNDVPVGE